MTVGGVQIWFAVMLAAAGALALAAIARRRFFWLVAAVFLAGTSAQLGLTDPRWFGSLQLRPDPFALLCFAVVALQAAVVAAVLLTGGRLAALWTGARALGLGRVVLLFLLLFGSSAAPMGFLQHQKYARFAVEVVADGAFLALNGATLVALAMLLPRGWLASAAARIDKIFIRQAPAVAGGTVGVRRHLILNLVAFDRLPRTDEVHYLFQAKTFALGQSTPWRRATRWTRRFALASSATSTANGSQSSRRAGPPHWPSGWRSAFPFWSIRSSPP